MSLVARDPMSIYHLFDNNMFGGILFIDDISQDTKNENLIYVLLNVYKKVARLK